VRLGELSDCSRVQRLDDIEADGQLRSRPPLAFDARTSARLVRKPLLDAALAAEDAIGGRVRVLDTASLASAWHDERRNLATVMSYSNYAKATEGVKAALASRLTIEPQQVSGDIIVTAAALPTSKDQCKNGGWRIFVGFRNQGQCVAFLQRGPKP
jgi:hypothetical protein